MQLLQCIDTPSSYVGQVQPIRKGHQVLYDPFDEANRSSEHMARPTQAGTARSRQHGDEASARAGRAFDQSRISFASSSQQRENRQQGRPPRSVRESETVPTLDRPGAGQKRRADADIRGAAKAGRFDEAAQPSQASVPIEDGEVEALPPAPQSHQVRAQAGMCCDGTTAYTRLGCFLCSSCGCPWWQHRVAMCYEGRGGWMMVLLDH